MHNALFHHTRRGNREPKRWNAAADYAINLILEASGFEPIEGWLLDQQYQDMTAEQIYNLLPDTPEGEGDDPGGCGGVEDGDKDGSTEATEAEMKQVLAQAVTIAKQKGKLPGSIQRMIDELLQPRIPWQEVLARFLSEPQRNDYSFRRPNPRYIHSGFYLPSLYSETLGDVILIVDTSGSIDQELLTRFASEMQGILSSFNKGFTVLYVDTEVAGVQEIEPDEPLILELKGGGGTSYIAPYKWIEEQGTNPVCVIYLTDGYCDEFPEEPSYPTLWCIYDNKGFNSPFGEVIHVD